VVDKDPRLITFRRTTVVRVGVVVLVLAARGGGTVIGRPATITVGCASGGVTVTDITWSDWAAAAGGQGRGTVNVGLQSAPAIVVVFHDVDGIFQDVSITPSKDVSSTTASTARTTVPTILPTTTTTAGGISPVAASQPGSGWGGE
jgi:hypothetical protein